MRPRNKFFSHLSSVIGFTLIILFGLIAIAAPLLSPADSTGPIPIKIVGNERDLIPQPPSESAPLGTLPKQISVYHALVWGTRSAVIFGVTITAISFIIGLLVGSLSAFYGGFLSNILMGVSNAFMAFPIIAAVLLFHQLNTISVYSNLIIDPWGNVAIDLKGNILYSASDELSNFSNFINFLLVTLRKFNPVTLAFALFSWMPYARVMHTSLLQVKQNEYVMAAHASGVRNARIIFRHLIPNAIAPLIVMAAKDVGGFVVLQTTLAFIGFGEWSSPWAMVLVLGRDWIYAGIFTYWWVFIPATALLVLFGLGWNLLGDGLNDAINPRKVN